MTTAIVTQHRADRREEIRWGRESRRELELRTLDARASAYVGFLKSWDEHYTMVLNIKQAAVAEPPAQVHLNTLYPYLVDVEIFGTHAAVARAKEAFAMLTEWSHSSTIAEIEDFAFMDTLREQVRSDLAVQD